MVDELTESTQTFEEYYNDVLSEAKLPAGKYFITLDEGKEFVHTLYRIEIPLGKAVVIVSSLYTNYKRFLV